MASRLRSLSVMVAVLGILGAVFILLYRTPPGPESGMPTGEFGGVSLTLEFATTAASRNKGLGGRPSIPDDYGMLFIFPKDDKYGFWMKDVSVPLDIFWLDDKGQVVTIAEDVSPASYPHVFYPTKPARYVLETAAGFARVHAIATGTPLHLQHWLDVSE